MRGFREGVICRAPGLLLLALGACSLGEQVPTIGYGINLAGAEFGTHRADFSNRNCGKYGQDYIFPSINTLGYYGERGLRIIRLPLSWERLQPTLGGGLDPVYTGRVLEQLDAASFHACKVVLDLHNYGRYRVAEGGLVMELTLDDLGGLRHEHLSDLWLRLGEEVRDHPALLAYGLMNEPHDMGAGNWHASSSQVVRKLREEGDRTWIWVAGDGWSKAHEWTMHNPTSPWIDDPLGRTVYEAHVYFDSDGSGRYQATFAQELQLDPGLAMRGVQRLEPFARWCREGGAYGVIGEFGVPWYDQGWIPVLERFLKRVDEADMSAIAWAGGDWWGDYPLSLQPRGDTEVAPLKAIMRFVAGDMDPIPLKGGGPAGQPAGPRPGQGE